MPRGAWAEEGAGDPLPPPASVAVDFHRDVEPILAAHCFKCHGPHKQESGFRLDRRAEVLRGGEFGEPAVVPGRSAESPMILYVGSPEADVTMPPQGPRLSSDEISLLRAWVDQGAKMPEEVEVKNLAAPRADDHWAFRPLGDVPPPAVDDPRVVNPIDPFILARLKEKGLGFAAEADRVSLIRRVTFDMLGLPPSPEEVARFAADSRPDAYERLVEAVLASPHYGERWARHWLDVVRFAETDGFEMNQERPNAYHYRDYVIRALNADRPYDRFLMEQLAGDALGEDAATGFLVGGPMDKVKSPDPVLTGMQRQDELTDVVNTTGTAMLGLTMGCARCHDHKFDPILQKDFYAMQAVFAGVQHGERPLRRPDLAQERQKTEQLRQQLVGLEQELLALAPQFRPPVNARKNVERFPPVVARFVRMTVLATNSGSQPCLDEIEVFATSASGPRRNVALASAGAKASSSGDLPGFEIHKLAHVHDGRYGNSASWISHEAGRGWVQIELAEPTEIEEIVWGRDREGKYNDRVAAHYVVEIADEPDAWRAVGRSEDRLPPSGAEAAVEQKLASLPADQANRARELLARIKSIEAQLDQAANRAVVYAGTFRQPGPTHRLYRGDPMQPREEVPPEAPSFLAERLGSLQLAADAPEPQRRLALARWIVRPDHPLTARVMVNRIWHYHFGRGIVETPSDFGHTGAPPTHPELLDWLSREFIRGGWSIKHIHRLILMSAAYRQSSRPSAEALAADSGNRLLGRFPSRRLEAEAIRDSVLRVAGTLDGTMFGPGFSLFEPNANYVRVYNPRESWGPDQWRRMVYATHVRMQQDGVFGAFDCPDAGQVAPRRPRSTTGIQALNLLNSNFMIQQSELLAKRVEREAGQRAEDQVRRAFELAFGRSAEEEEAADGVRLVRQHGLPALCRALLNANEFVFLP